MMLYAAALISNIHKLIILYTVIFLSEIWLNIKQKKKNSSRVNEC